MAMKEKLRLIKESQNAFLSIEIKKRLIERLSLIKLNPQKILDMNESRDLLSLYPNSEIVDLENVKEQSVDLIFSNLSLCWIENPRILFKQWKKALTLQGCVLFSTLGPRTLGPMNLGHAFPFLDLEELGQALFEAGFASPVVERETITLTYEKGEKAIEDIESLGLSYFMHQEGKIKEVHRYLSALEKKKEVPYEVFYGQAFQTVEKPIRFMRKS